MLIVTPLQALFGHFARWQGLGRVCIRFVHSRWLAARRRPQGAPCLHLLRRYHHRTIEGSRRAAAPCHARGRPLGSFEPPHLHVCPCVASGKWGEGPRLSPSLEGPTSSGPVLLQVHRRTSAGAAIPPAHRPLPPPSHPLSLAPPSPHTGVSPMVSPQDPVPSHPQAGEYYFYFCFIAAQARMRPALPPPRSFSSIHCTAVYRTVPLKLTVPHPYHTVL